MFRRLKASPLIRRDKFGRVLSDAETLEAVGDFRRLLRRATFAYDSSPAIADAVSTHLRQTFTVARLAIEGPNQFVSVPACDIVLRGAAFPNDLAGTLVNQLTLMHGAYVDKFRVSLIGSGAVAPGMIEAYFGRGVFSPTQETPRVADFELFFPSAREIGDGPPSNDTAGLVPVLRGQSGQNAGDPAAWYAGQSGLAIAFREGGAPAAILSESIDASWNELLGDLVLFFGRRTAADEPTIVCFRHEGAGARHLPSLVPQHTAWHVEDGVWQYVEIEGRKFWFRFTNRTGASLFMTDPVRVRARAEACGGAYGLVLVEGLILPEMPTWFTTYARWRVNFQRGGKLRHSEAMSVARTLSAQPRGQYGVFDHDEGVWKGEERSPSDRMVLPLDGSIHLTLREPSALREADAAGRSRRARQADARFRSIYGTDSNLLQCDGPFSAASTLGAFFLPAAPDETVWVPIAAGPVSAGADSEEMVPVSLDWVNRAACLDGETAMGLAEYWLHHWSLEAGATPDSLKVRVGLADGSVVEYAIDDGSCGAFGPVWVRYLWCEGEER